MENKMKLQVVKMYFKGPLALMDRKKDEFVGEVLTIPSDKLKGAFAYALDRIGKKVEDFWDDIMISSAFPFLDVAEDSIYFFPRPMYPLPVKPSTNPKHAKNIKKIMFLGNRLFEKTIRNEEFDLYKEVVPVNNDARFISLKTKDRLLQNVSFMQSQSEGKVALGNIYNVGTEFSAAQPSPFYVSRTFYDTERAGLYFIFEGDKDKMIDALEFFKTEGLGADKTYGNGIIKGYEILSITLNVPANHKGWIVLSKYIPREDEMNILQNARLKMTKYGGFIAGAAKEQYRHWAKKMIWMIDEGSYFPSAIKPEGKYVNVVNEDTEKVLGHPVWREGRPIAIPVNLKM